MQELSVRNGSLQFFNLNSPRQPTRVLKAALLVGIAAAFCSLAAAQSAHFGSFESTVVSSGLHGPNNVAVDANGNVYIPDNWNHRVVKETLSAGGTYVQTTLGSGWQVPWGIAIDAGGSLYVSDTGLSQVIKLTPS